MKLPGSYEEDGSAVMGECSLCGDELYAGQSCYHINGETVCEDCLAEYARHVFAGFARRIGEE